MNTWSTVGALLLFLGINLATINASYCGSWIPIDWQPLVKEIEPSDEIQVYSLVAPLLYCDFKDTLSYVNAYHGGLGFLNIRTKKAFTVNYDASPSFTRAIIPGINKQENGTSLMWENYGKVFIYDGINSTYWHSENLLTATLNGTQMYDFMNWLSKANDTYPYYNVWSVWTSFPGKVLLPNNECFQFVWDCYDILKKIGAVFNSEAHPKASFVSLYSDTRPKEVNVSDPQEWKDVVTFYETVEAKISQEGIATFLIELWDVVIDGLFYVRDNETYYRVKLVDFPYFGIHYTSLSTPWNQ